MPKAEETIRAEIVTPPPAPPQRRIERFGGTTQPRVRRYPQIIAGVCEYHGTVNPYVPGQEQYKYCPNDGKHPVWTEVQCSYCEEYKDPQDVIKKSTMNIYNHPTNPEEMVVVCDNFTCVQRHQARFKVA